MTKITFIGAGSVVFTKNLLGDILTFPELQDCTISLHDTNAIRLDTADRMARWTVQAVGAKARIEAFADRQEAIRDADFVINMIQVGMHEATLIDFDIPRKYGLKQTIGDTHGIGGIFRALRTIPVMQAITGDMQEVAPGAILLNYTNPMAMLVWSVFESSYVPVVGLCHSVQHTTRQIAEYAGVPYDEIVYLGAGINHLAFILRFLHKGKDAYPRLRQALEDGRIPADDLVRAELFRRLGYYVTESSEHNAEYSPYFIPHAG